MPAPQMWLRTPLGRGGALPAGLRQDRRPAPAALSAILEKLRRFRVRAFGQTLEPEREVQNTDALAATPGKEGDHIGLGHSNFPPNYVKTDDGRPRH
jgi:hypothetical protein